MTAKEQKKKDSVIKKVRKLCDKYAKELKDCKDYTESDDIHVVGGFVGEMCHLYAPVVTELDTAIKVVLKVEFEKHSSYGLSYEKQEDEFVIPFDDKFDDDYYYVNPWDDLKDQIKEYEKYIKKTLRVFKSDNPDRELECDDSDDDLEGFGDTKDDYLILMGL